MKNHIEWNGKVNLPESYIIFSVWKEQNHSVNGECERDGKRQMHANSVGYSLSLKSWCRSVSFGRCRWSSFNRAWRDWCIFLQISANFISLCVLYFFGCVLFSFIVFGSHKSIPVNTHVYLTVPKDNRRPAKTAEYKWIQITFLAPVSTPSITFTHSFEHNWTSKYQN